MSIHGMFNRNMYVYVKNKHALTIYMTIYITTSKINMKRNTDFHMTIHNNLIINIHSTIDMSKETRLLLKNMLSWFS